MADSQDSRDRVASLRSTAVETLASYAGGFRELERVDRDVKFIIRALEEIADPSWTSTLITRWGYLEMTYASALVHERFTLSDDEEHDMHEAIRNLLTEFERYEIPLEPQERPREHDVVRLLTARPENSLAAGSTGTVVVDYTEYTGDIAPAEYEVEFPENNGAPAAMITVPGEDLEVVSRPGYSGSSSHTYSTSE